MLAVHLVDRIGTLNLVSDQPQGMAGKLVSDQPAEQAGKLVSDQLPEKTKKSASDQPLRSLNDTQRKIIRMCDMYLQRPSGARSRAACGRDRLAAGGGRRRPPRVAARSRARHCGATSAGLSQTANYLFIQQIECSNLIRRQRQESSGHQEFDKARLAQLKLDYEAFCVAEAKRYIADVLPADEVSAAPGHPPPPEPSASGPPLCRGTGENHHRHGPFRNTAEPPDPDADS
jgi:hypothetical protein